MTRCVKCGAEPADFRLYHALAYGPKGGPVTRQESVFYLCEKCYDAAMMRDLLTALGKLVAEKDSGCV